MEIKQLEKELLNSWKLDKIVEPIKSNLISLLKNSLLCHCNYWKENLITANELHVQFVINSILLNFVEGISSISWSPCDSFTVFTNKDSPVFHKIYELFIKWREEIIPQLYEKQLIMSFFNSKQLYFLASVLSNLNDFSFSSLKIPSYKDNLINYLEKDLWLVCIFDENFHNNYVNLFYNQFFRYILNRVIYLNLYCSSKSKAILEVDWQMILVNLLQIINLIVNIWWDWITTSDNKKTIIDTPTQLLQ